MNTYPTKKTKISINFFIFFAPKSFFKIKKGVTQQDIMVSHKKIIKSTDLWLSGLLKIYVKVSILFAVGTLQITGESKRSVLE